MRPGQMRTVPVILMSFIVWNACSLSACSDPAHALGHAESPISSQQSADARVALDAMTLSLRAVRSGTCRMQCRYQYDPNEDGKGKHSDTGENIFLAFDKTQGLYRYDDLETRYSGRPNQIVVRPDLVLSSPGDWTITDPSNTGSFTHSRMIVRRSRSDVDNPFQRHRDPFVTVLADCLANKMHETQSGVLDLILDKTIPNAIVVSYEKAEPDFARIKLQQEYPDMKVTVEQDLTLNVAHAYVPVRVLIRHNGTKSGRWTAPDVIETEWISPNGVYVPKRSKSIGTTYRKSELTFTMEWEHVNETLSPALFSEEAFSPQTGDLVTVAKADQFVVEKIIGIELPKLPARQPDPPPRYWRFALILLANALAFGAVFYLLRRRRLASRKS